MTLLNPAYPGGRANGLMSGLARVMGLKPSLDYRRTAIIDIGSNSIRLVVYEGPGRLPFVLFNEKIMAGLGASLVRTGLIEEDAMTRGIAALARFRHLCRDMEVDQIRCVATAAVREAKNGSEFVLHAAALGLDVEILTGREEGEASGYGVISAIPDADGIVGDMGGGSLELVRIAGGRIINAVSLPLGVLRIPALRAGGEAAFDQQVTAMLDGVDWLAQARDLPFYMVGGSWRALGRVDMHFNDFPLPVIHHYEMTPRAPRALIDRLSRVDKAELRAIPSVTASRIPTLPDAALLLDVLSRRLKSTRLIISSYGLREGLLYAELPELIRAQDPLLAVAEVEGESQGRFPGHGELIDRFIAPLFDDDPPDLRRLRRASCLLADVGWRANPEFRAARGVEIALHGNWVGVTIRDRALMAQALCSNFGGTSDMPAWCQQIAGPQMKRAHLWGLAIRLGQRLSGGVAGPLELGRLEKANGKLHLVLPTQHSGLYGEAVEKRLRQLATPMGLEYGFRIDGNASGSQAAF